MSEHTWANPTWASEEELALYEQYLSSYQGMVAIIENSPNPRQENLYGWRNLLDAVTRTPTRFDADATQVRQLLEPAAKRVLSSSSQPFAVTLALHPQVYAQVASELDPFGECRSILVEKTTVPVRLVPTLGLDVLRVTGPYGEVLSLTFIPPRGYPCSGPWFDAFQSLREKGFSRKKAATYAREFTNTPPRSKTPDLSR